MPVAENKGGGEPTVEKVTFDEDNVEPGFHVTKGNEHIAGPYETVEDAQMFIDGHLGGDKAFKVAEVAAAE